MYFFGSATHDTQQSASRSTRARSGSLGVRPLTTVLVPFDRSVAARCALDYAVDLAKHEGSRIHLLNVQSTPRDEAVFYEVHRQMGEHILDAARAQLEEVGVACMTEVRFGPVAEAIVDCASKARCARIVIGERTGTRSRNSSRPRFRATSYGDPMCRSPW